MWAILAAFFKPLAEAFFREFGDAIRDWRADQNAQALGAERAKRQGAEAIAETAKRQADAAVNAPSEDELIAKLEAGGAV